MGMDIVSLEGDPLKTAITLFETSPRNALSYIHSQGLNRLAIIREIEESGKEVTINGKLYQGPALGARLRAASLKLSSHTIGMEWHITSLTLLEMSDRRDYTILRGASSLSEYLDEDRPGQIDANRASAMIAWASEIVPRLQAHKIPIESILQLPPSLLERLVPSMRIGASDRRGRPATAKSRADDRVFQVIIDWIRPDSADPVRKEADVERLIIHNRAIVEGTEIMNKIAAGGRDPVQEYIRQGPTRMAYLADHLLSARAAPADIVKVLDSATQLTDSTLRAYGNKPHASSVQTIDPERDDIPSAISDHTDDPVMIELTDPSEDGLFVTIQSLAPVPVIALRALERAGVMLYIRRRGQPERITLDQYLAAQQKL